MTLRDAGGLLSIDVAAEARKLAEARLSAPFRLGAELVRRALLAGARRVQVDTRGGRLVVADDGAPLEADVVARLRLALDGQAEDAARHGALVELESRAPELLGLLALRPRAVQVEPRAGGTRILAQAGFDREALAHWIRVACRFAAAEVVLDGAPLRPGFEDAIAEVALLEPLAGRVALPRRGSVAVVWALLDGVLESHLTVSGLPPFEAALELSGRCGPRATAARLREEVVALVDPLAQQAAGLILAAGRRHGELSPDDGARVRELLLDAAERALAPELRSLPVFPLRQAGAFRPASLDALARAASARPLLVVDPTERAALVPTSAPVLAASLAERSRLAAVLGLAFQPAPLRPRRTLLSAAFNALDRARRALRARLSGHGRVLAGDELTAAEAALLAALEEALAGEAEPRRVALCAGRRGPARFDHARGAWLLPREHPAVRRAAARLIVDRPLLYPLLLALCEGEPPPTSLRQLWRESHAPR